MKKSFRKSMLMALMLMLASVGAWAQGLTPVGFDPEDGSVKEGSFPATFTVKFDEALTLDNTKVGDIKLYKNSVDAANEIAPEAGSWSVNLESGKKNVYIYSLDEYFEGVQYITAEAGAKYILVVPAGLVKNATEVANEEIQLTINGPEQVVAEPVKLLSSDPFSGAVYEGYAPVSFELTFDSEVKTTSALIGSNVKLFKGSKDGEEYVPDGGWNFSQGSDKTKVQVFAMDMDYYVDNLNIQAGDKYFLVISEGTFTNAADGTNEEIVIELNGPEQVVAEPVKLVSSDPANGTKAEGYTPVSFELTFDSEVKTTSALIGSNVKLFKGSKDGEEYVPDGGWNFSQGSDKTKVQVFAMDMDYYVDNLNIQAGDKYFLVISGGTFTNANGDQNEEIVIELNGPDAPATAFNPTSIYPEEGGVMQGFLGIVFPRLELTFDEAAKIVAAKPAVELRKGSEDGEVLPIDHWALVESSDTKTVILEGRDAVDDPVNFTAEGIAYYFIIPAGVVENADGAKNEKMVIKVYGTEGAATGISSVVSEGKTLKGDVYTIGGVKVRKSGESLNGLKGVYIVNGKKVVVK